ncbi:hypothetical protein [Micromonospora sp. 067-2]|uniref:hypothetical protein n=1 Tax=Micromonospora sp. 067-2 TaxID=2789270 RepID=UPI00397C0344
MRALEAWHAAAGVLMSAKAPTRPAGPDPIVDATLIPIRDHRLVAWSKKYQYSTKPAAIWR